MVLFLQEDQEMAVEDDVDEIPAAAAASIQVESHDWRCYFLQEDQKMAVAEDVDEIPAAAAESAPEVPCPDCGQLFESRASLKV